MGKRIFCLLLCIFALFPISRATVTDVPITRGAFLLLLWQSWGGVPYDVTAHPFSDLSDDALAQAAGWAFDLGLICGVGGGRFAPDLPLSRQDCALLLRRGDALEGRDVWLPDGVSICDDGENLSPWAGDSLSWACITGRMGWREGHLAPLDPVTQEEALSYLFSQ